MQRGKGKNSCDGRKNQNNQSEQILHLPLCIGVRLKTLKGSVNTIIEKFTRYRVSILHLTKGTFDLGRQQG